MRDILTPCTFEKKFDTKKILFHFRFYVVSVWISPYLTIVLSIDSRLEDRHSVPTFQLRLHRVLLSLSKFSFLDIFYVCR